MAFEPPPTVSASAGLRSAPTAAGARCASAAPAVTPRSPIGQG
jgi:hypothetical protein